MLVVDTWNYQIRHINAAGDLLAQWGSPGEFGFDAPQEPVDGFWGPRDVVVSNDGMIFVSDTGNKRIRVYRLGESEALHLFDIGRGGSGTGELDEPSGLALHSDGRLFVADTWNRRVSVFDVSGNHLAEFRVRGWYSSTINRPYLALDEGRNLLYVTDPDSNRVLVYHPGGDCVGSFGQDGTNGANGQFQAIAGIAVDADGFVYISDSTAGKVFKFPPFPAQAIPAG
jgi:DNA-binding beta-propeller fold protein YncE